MPIGLEGLTYRRYRVPREDRRVLAEPPLAEVDGTIRENLRLQAEANYDVQGRALRELTAQARTELLAAARRWTAAYRPETAAKESRADLIFLAGHQPELVHPGVWLKHFVLDALARRHGATAINLVIDSDDIKHAAVRTPGGSASEPIAEMIPFDRAEPRVPYEERRVEDRGLFADFGRRAAARLAPLVGRAAAEVVLALGLGAIAGDRPLGRRAWRRRGICWKAAGDSTRWKSRKAGCVKRNRSRGLRRICWPICRGFGKSTTKPCGNIARCIGCAARPSRCPIWPPTGVGSKRRFGCGPPNCRSGGDCLSSRWAMNCGSPITPGWRRGCRWLADGDAAGAVAQLSQLRGRGVKLRSRALITTLWARLVLGDLFLHGIGGAKYDQVTDLLVERFFGLPAPGILVLSATLHLPIARPPARTAGAAAIARQLRDLTYKPERFLHEWGRRCENPTDCPAVTSDSPCAAEPTTTDDDMPAALRTLLDAKAHWIHTPQTPTVRTRAGERFGRSTRPSSRG